MNLVFWVAGVIAILAAAAAVTRRNPIYAALFTLVALGGVAVEFALMHAPFLAAMQILLYAGAIMVLFVFVIMLLSLRPEEHGDEPGLPTKAFAGLVAFGVYFILAKAIAAYPGGGGAFAATDDALAKRTPEFGSVAHFGHFLYGNSVVPFELVSVLLTAALAAVLILARKRSPVLDPMPPASKAEPPHHAGPPAPEPQAMAASAGHLGGSEH